MRFRLTESPFKNTDASRCSGLQNLRLGASKERLGVSTRLCYVPSKSTSKVMLPKRRFWKAEPTFQNAFSKHFSTFASPNPVLTPVKSASKTHSEMLVRPSKIFVWEGKSITKDSSNRESFVSSLGSPNEVLKRRTKDEMRTFDVSRGFFISSNIRSDMAKRDPTILESVASPPETARGSSQVPWSVCVARECGWAYRPRARTARTARMAHVPIQKNTSNNQRRKSR